MKQADRISDELFDSLTTVGLVNAVALATYRWQHSDDVRPEERLLDVQGCAFFLRDRGITAGELEELITSGEPLVPPGQLEMFGSDFVDWIPSFFDDLLISVKKLEMSRARRQSRTKRPAGVE